LRQSFVLVGTFRARSFLFNLHIAKFVGVENFATFDAFHIFHVFLAGDDTNSWVFAEARHSVLNQSFAESFPPDCTEPFLFVQEGFVEESRLLLFRRQKIPFLPIKAAWDIPQPPIEIAMEMAVH
jgi:hypothetical protein